ncbi:MAG TPA: class I SAM-dependent methyltransferase [Candidatus Udaeobacter sp.]|nr:class I SAM-dependent methyltransferase [Candidatus Udaeobacter sp.]
MKYDWKSAGEEWSAPWGTSAAQWFGAILPRIENYLPASTILEIAPGFGRWTHYLKDYCNELWVVDKSSECIEACQRRFAGVSHVRCFLNDGRSLSMIPDNSVDFVFSFDSFVHPNRDVIEAYLRELGTKLKSGGKGFIHHSNFGEYANSLRERIPQALAKPLIKARILDWAHHRNPGMSADLFRALCAQHGLHCVSQELVNWRGRRLIDCLSTFVRADSPEQEPTKTIRNPNFMREAAQIRRQWESRSNQS